MASDVVELTAGIADLVLASDADQLRVRPRPETWSPLEYACHVRDVLLVQRERVLLARREDCPTLAPMGRDERVEHDGYAAQDPADVARQLQDAATLFSGVISRLDEQAWNRTLVYSWPSSAERNLRWTAVHTVHELRHHTADIRTGLGLDRE